MSFIGLLLAAGRGRRMGGNKQFHIVPTPDGDKPLVAAAFDTIAHACDCVFVVVGHRAEEVVAALGDRKFEIVMANPDAPMFDSIVAGLNHALSRTATRSRDSPVVLLQLGDHPALEPATLEQLLGVATDNPDKAVMPAYRGNGGHPVLIPAKVAEQILASCCPDGLRGFWQQFHELCLRIEVADPGVVRNINTL